ncbi:MAG: sigma-70 family RNA polymerase sigma factor [Gemmatimonadales bacterium]
MAATTASMSADQAIPALYADQQDMIFQLGLHMLGGNSEDAWDLVQETFLRAYEAWESFEGRAQPSTWLYTIARRTALRMRRRRAGQPAHMEPLSEELCACSVFDGPGAETDPLDALIAEEEQQRLHEALAMLPTRYRLPVSLKELGGLSVEDVADVLELKQGTVKSRLHRGRNVLANLLELPSTPGPAPSQLTCA